LWGEIVELWNNGKKMSEKSWKKVEKKWGKIYYYGVIIVQSFINM
jgi:hypothetical protein